MRGGGNGDRGATLTPALSLEGRGRIAGTEIAERYVTERIYLDDPYQREFDARVVASVDEWCALSRSAFYPGGGGQPCDRGVLHAAGETFAVSGVREDEAGVVWHEIGRSMPVGEAVRGEIEWPYRYALMRGHALMHVVNTVARDRYGGAITGVQIGPERSRIDFKLAAFTREQVPEFDRLVNDVIARGLGITSTVIGVDEYRRRPELVRTLNVAPPVGGDGVRVVRIEGFDAQACGGTHVHHTGEIGPVALERLDNKGKDNKRFYWATLDRR